MDKNENAVSIDKNDPLKIAEYTVSVLDAKKAADIKLLHVADKTIIADYMIMCSANSGTQIKSLADEVGYKLGLCGISASHIEGVPSGGWVLLDYGSVLVHIFSREARRNYNLEKLYEEGDEIDISALLGEN